MSTTLQGSDERILGRPPGEASYQSQGNNPDRGGTGLPTVSSFEGNAVSSATPSAGSTTNPFVVLLVVVGLLLAAARAIPEFGPWEKAPWWVRSHEVASVLGLYVGGLIAIFPTWMWSKSTSKSTTGKLWRFVSAAVRIPMGIVTFLAFTFAGASVYIGMAGLQEGVNRWEGLGPFWLSKEMLLTWLKQVAPLAVIWMGAFVARIPYRCSNI